MSYSYLAVGGGGIYGGMLLGHTCVCAVEIDADCRSTLLQRQRDGIMPRFPIWDDIRTFDGRPWRGLVDIVAGGFPCQDVSVAGKGAGIEGERSGLWKEMARVVCEIRPSYVFVKNTPMLTSRGLGRILRDLAALRYDAKWCVLSASDVGAPHRRERIWILANANSHRFNGADILLPEKKTCDFAFRNSEAFTNPSSNGLERSIHLENCSEQNQTDWREIARRIVPTSWEGNHPEPGILRMDAGLADWKHRIKTLGNGQVPLCAAVAWKILNNEL